MTAEEGKAIVWGIPTKDIADDEIKAYNMTAEHQQTRVELFSSA